MREITHLSTTVFLADRQTEDTEASELAPEIVREKVLFFDRRSPRSNLVRRKSVDRVAQHVDIFAEREVQRLQMAHRNLLDLSVETFAPVRSSAPAVSRSRSHRDGFRR